MRNHFTNVPDTAMSILILYSQIISGTSKTVSGTQNLERNVPNTAHQNVPTNSLLLGTLFLLVFPVYVREQLELGLI